MRTLYCWIITMLTDLLSGLDHSNLKLWDVATWFETEKWVSIGVNCVIAVMLIYVAWCVYDVVSRKLNNVNLKEVEG